MSYAEAELKPVTVYDDGPAGVQLLGDSPKRNYYYFNSPLKRRSAG